MSNARKLFRVLKFLIEYKKINQILGKADSIPVYKLILQLCPRIAFFFYWMFDTLIILTKIKVINGLDMKWLMHKWASLWTFANFTGILGAIVDLVEIGKEESKLIAQKRVNSSL